LGFAPATSGEEQPLHATSAKTSATNHRHNITTDKKDKANKGGLGESPGQHKERVRPDWSTLCLVCRMRSRKKA
jgi:hypothetical protein